VLGATGFEAYEVSNHARGEAARSVHNLAYWRGWDYLGVGPGAHGRITLEGGRVATEAPRRVGDYIAGTGFGQEQLSPWDAAVERLLLGLRTLEGVPLADVAALGIAQERMEALTGLVDVIGGRLVATSQGRAVLDRVTAELVN
jgi:oxygen-independent coproporphyrinogen-3 oxidase